MKGPANVFLQNADILKIFWHYTSFPEEMTGCLKHLFQSCWLWVDGFSFLFIFRSHCPRGYWWPSGSCRFFDGFSANYGPNRFPQKFWSGQYKQELTQFGKSPTLCFRLCTTLAALGFFLFQHQGPRITTLLPAFKSPALAYGTKILDSIHWLSTTIWMAPHSLWAMIAVATPWGSPWSVVPHYLRWLWDYFSIL